MGQGRCPRLMSFPRVAAARGIPDSGGLGLSLLAKIPSLRVARFDQFELLLARHALDLLRAGDRLINFTEFLEVHQPVHVVAGGERAGLAFPVLNDAAFEVIFLCARRRLLSSACAALRLVGNAGIERSRETAHDIHVVVMLAYRLFGRKDSGFFGAPRRRCNPVDERSTLAIVGTAR